MNKQKLITKTSSIWIIIFFLSIPIWGSNRIKLLNPDTQIILHINNTKEFFNSIKSTSFYKLWNHPKMKPFLNNGNFINALKKDFFDLKKNNSKNKEILNLLDNELEMLNGEVIIGLNFGKNFQLFLLAKMDKTNYKKSLLIDQKLKDLDYKKSISKTYMFRNIQIIENIYKKDKNNNSIWQAHYKNTYIESSNKKWLEKALIQLEERPLIEPEYNPSLKISVNPSLIKTLLIKKRIK